ncbi:MAG: GIY-YIG nuclease family protein [Bacteriovoracaceae bacterium]|nr:GIY-YIG nuclease family protein [Bacteriovoracaceae bacterium]
MDWTVYIIQTKSGKLYTGITTDLDRRFDEHKTGKKGARFFNFSKPQKVVYFEKCSSRSAASKREYAIKKMKRCEKLSLVKKCG